MISLYCNTDNPFSRYGVNHFIEKFGLPIIINKPSQFGIIISYGTEVKGEFVIKMQENEIKNNICGKISKENEKIPLCEIPYNTGTEGDVIAFFENNATMYPCVTQNDHGSSIGIDIFKETGYLLSGHLDSVRLSVDNTTKKELELKPTVDFLEDILFKAILAGFYELNIPLVQKSYWPDGKKFAVCLTHDIDEIKKTYQWITRPLRLLAKGNFHGLNGQFHSFLQKIKGTDPYYTFEDIIRIENALGVKSTYFILIETGKTSLFLKETWYLHGRNRSLQSPGVQALIQRLISNGDEVAIHGSYFSYKDPGLLKDEIRSLEKLINEKVIGTRQHNLNLEIPATWNHQVNAGLKYDTTLGFNETIGFRWGTSFPFFPNIGEKPLHLLEIPLIIMDNPLLSCDNREKNWMQITDEVERYQGVLTLLWHPPIFNTLEYPDARDLYIKINQYCQARGAWIARACDIYEWIDIRNQNTFTFDYDTATKMCTIILSPGKHDHFFTIYQPPHTQYDISSGNAHNIRRGNNCVYLKTQNLHNDNNNKIIVTII